MAYALWERSTLETFFKDNWAETPIKWENHAFTIPATIANGAYSAYVAFFLRSGTGVVVSLGSSLLERQASLIVVQVFTPELTDKLVSLTYTDLLLDLWIPRDFTDGSNVIRTRPPYPNVVGVNSGWFQTNVIVPYVLDAPIANYQT